MERFGDGTFDGLRCISACHCVVGCYDGVMCGGFMVEMACHVSW